LVTGVQTCALPICFPSRSAGPIFQLPLRRWTLAGSRQIRLTPSIARSATLRLPGRPWRRVESCRSRSPLPSRPSSSPSRCTSTSGWYASNSLAVHPASPKAELPRRRAPVFGAPDRPSSRVLHYGFATANGNDSHVLPIQSPAALDAGRCSIIRRAGGGLGLRHLRLHSQRRRGSRILGHAGIALQLRVRLHQQNWLRSGTGAATAAQVVNSPSNPALGGGEIERQTINRYLSMGMSYSPNSEWNVSVLVPYVMRSHTTFGQQQSPYSSSETASTQ